MSGEGSGKQREVPVNIASWFPITLLLGCGVFRRCALNGPHRARAASGRTPSCGGTSWFSTGWPSLAPPGRPPVPRSASATAGPESRRASGPASTVSWPRQSAGAAAAGECKGVLGVQGHTAVRHLEQEAPVGCCRTRHTHSPTTSAPSHAHAPRRHTHTVLSPSSLPPPLSRPAACPTCPPPPLRARAQGCAGATPGRAPGERPAPRGCGARGGRRPGPGPRPKGL